MNLYKRLLNKIDAFADGANTILGYTEQHRKLRWVTATAADATWTTGDGGRVRVRAMSDSHLFYAIAKAHRNEYPDSRTRKVGVRALQVEALCRLARTVAGVRL